MYISNHLFFITISILLQYDFHYAFNYITLSYNVIALMISILLSFSIMSSVALCYNVISNIISITLCCNIISVILNHSSITLHYDNFHYIML